MLCKTGFFLLIVAVSQVLADYVEVDFIENVINDANQKSSGSRIVSGWDAVPGQHPHQVSLRMVGPVGDVSACGGSIIHREWVLSAAHCTAGRVTLVIRAGVTNLTNPEYISESTIYFNHPTYNDFLPSVVQPNDIAVIKLVEPVTFSDLLQPIRLQNRADAFRNYDGQVLYASGYGRTWTGGSTPEVLNWVYLRGVANLNCFMSFGSIITDTTICARFFNVTSQSVCQGDSGGPLVHVDSDGVPTLVGVTSFVAGGDAGCHSGFPAGFIRPGPFLGWLEEVTSINFETEDIFPTEPPTTTTSTTTSTTTTTTTTTTEAPEPEKPEPEQPEPEEEVDSEEDSDAEGEEDSDEDDPELSELLKRLEVQVKVKVRVNKYKKKHSVHQKH